MRNSDLQRRRFFRHLLGGVSALLVAGCDSLSRSEWFPKVLSAGEKLNEAAQHLITPRSAMAQEFTEADLSPSFRSNGTAVPQNPLYHALAANGFADYRLEVTGLVERPSRFSLVELRAMPSRTQITRHDCVEGWSAIGQWTGVPLSLLLKAAGLQVGARYAVFYCADNLEGEPSKGGEQSPGQYYESIGLADALHPQTLIAYNLNGKPLEVAHGAPLRLRVERQLGYKQAKYVRAIELVESFAQIRGGQGGYWEDEGYEWYGGI